MIQYGWLLYIISFTSCSLLHLYPKHEKREAQKKKDGAKHELLNLAQIAKQNLANKNGDVSKITKKYICSLLLACYGKEVEEHKHHKPSLVQKLSSEIAKRPEAVAVAITAAANTE